MREKNESDTDIRFIVEHFIDLIFIFFLQILKFVRIDRIDHFLKVRTVLLYILKEIPDLGSEPII